MRTDSGTRSRLRLLRSDVAQVIFGPWPIRPFLIGFIIFLSLQYSDGVRAESTNQVIFATFSTVPMNVLRAAALAMVLAMLLAGYRRLTGRQEPGRAAYLLILFVFACIAATTRYLIFSEATDKEPLIYLAFILRSMLLITITLSALGVADAQLRAQMRRTDAALVVVRTQRSAVLEAEERARQSIATILHDRVQAGLVAATLQLKQIANALKGEEGTRLHSVIADLETIRTQDVRSASRQLSPDLRNITVTQALKVLASTYEPAMRTSIDVDALEAAALLRDSESPLRLGVYRIVEQALLNAAAHGSATEVRVLAERLDDDLVLTISDNGSGLGPDPIEPGAGSTIIDAWTAAMQGTWALDEGPSGTQVIVCVPFAGD